MPYKSHDFCYVPSTVAAINSPIMKLYRIVSYRIVSYRIVSYRIVSYRIVSYRIVSYRIFPIICCTTNVLFLWNKLSFNSILKLFTWRGFRLKFWTFHVDLFSTEEVNVKLLLGLPFPHFCSTPPSMIFLEWNRVSWCDWNSSVSVLYFYSLIGNSWHLIF